MTGLRRASAFLAGVAAMAVAISPALAQIQKLPGKKSEPVHIEAEKGIEWRQKKKVYVARGNATVKRGDVTIRAEVLTAHYRTKKDKATGKAKGGGKAKAKPAVFGSAAGTGGADVYKVTAAGGVRITQADKDIRGDLGVYDLDTGIFKLTGRRVSMKTAKEQITAEKKIEYRTKQKIAIVEGNAIAIKDDKKVRADRFTAYFADGKDGKLELVKVIASGRVVITTPTEVASADRGIYNQRTGVAQLIGSVKLTRGDNQLNGDRAEVNLKTGVSRLLAAPDKKGRVRVLVIPGGDVGGLSKGGLPGIPGSRGKRGKKNTKDIVDPK